MEESRRKYSAVERDRSLAGVATATPRPGVARITYDGDMHDSEDDLEEYHATQELNLYKEYRDVLHLFTHIVETERRFYLTNHVELTTVEDKGQTYFEIYIEDGWVWDVFRPNRFIHNARVISFKDVNIEELPHQDLDVSTQAGLGPAPYA